MKDFSKICYELLMETKDEKIRDLIYYSLDLHGSIGKISHELGTDPDELSCILKISRLNRQINNQRKTIAQLRKSGRKSI